MPLTQCVRALAKTLAADKTSVQYPAMPINIKTPACPVVVSPPPSNVEGEWRFQTAGHHIKATFHDNHAALRGYVLTGDRVKEKLQLTTLLPPILDTPAKDS